MIDLTHILVPTDFGDAANAALAYGRELARAFGAQLDVLHVADSVMGRAYGVDGFVTACPELQHEIEESARRQLDALVGDGDRAIPPAARTIVRTSTSTAGAITQYARDESVDLIVMGTHGRGAVAHLLVGSVAERVVRTAPCPVLTVRHPEREFVLPDALAAERKA
jgi:nucleotide-binding universal stress UspA family protein